MCKIWGAQHTLKQEHIITGSKQLTSNLTTNQNSDLFILSLL